MFFVSVAQCVCVCTLLGKGYKEAKCIFRAMEELVFKFVCLCLEEMEKENLGGSLCVLFNT